MVGYRLIRIWNPAPVCISVSGAKESIPRNSWAPYKGYKYRLCVQLYVFAETPQLPPSPRIWAHIRGRYWSAKIDDISF
jgi:hypothetical protein